MDTNNIIKNIVQAEGETTDSSKLSHDLLRVDYPAMLT